MTAVTTGKIDGLLDEAPFVSALARALAGGDADDVAQGTWLRAIEGGTEVLRSPRDWLTCVVRGVARNLQRGRARRRRHEHAAAARGQVPSS
ncbi:MAG: hypothetical protein KDC98_15355, partial [Planctomycetes bacterium]|nr:hypothetical protein [Planctomycetota bacterium]